MRQQLAFRTPAMHKRRSTLAAGIAPAGLTAALWLGLAFTALGAELRPVTETTTAATNTAAAALVEQALTAEVAGDADARRDLLHQALAVDPQHAAAHWQLGEVRVGDQWLPANVAGDENAWSGKFHAYRQLRNTTPARASDQLKLARWCSEAGLPDQERIHLTIALNAGPNRAQRREVMEKLDLVRFHNRDLPAQQVAAIKQRSRQADAAMKRWKPVLTRLRTDLESRDPTRREIAREELSQVDATAIPALEALFAKSTAEAGVAAVATLAGFPGQASTDSLVRHAIFARHEEVRTASAEALKSRDVFSYAPQLISSLNAPIEMSFQATSYEGGGFGARLSLFREGALYDVSMTDSATAVAGFTPRPGVPMFPLTAGAEREIANRAASGAAIAASVAAENARTELLNQRITATLRTALGKEDMGDEAKEWWDWWAEHNENYLPEDKPTLESARQSFVYYAAREFVPEPPRQQSASPPAQPVRQSAPRVSRNTECFAPGTPVWTVTGKVPIENVAVGDWVLSQNVESGELTYKPVIATTNGPALPIVDIRIGGSTIRATYGHLFWVTGAGWRMAKELQAGQQVRTTRGSATIESVSKSDDSPCHNLIIPEFNTYFVSDEQVLVHDILVRSPSTVKVPGLAARE